MGIRDAVDAALNTSYGEAMVESRERLTAQNRRFIVIYEGRWQATPRWLFWKPKWRRRVLQLGARQVANYVWQYAVRISIVNFGPQPEALVSPPGMAEAGSQTEAQPPLETAAAESPGEAQLAPEAGVAHSATQEAPREATEAESRTEAQPPPETAVAGLSTEAAGAAPCQPPPSGAEPPTGEAGTQEAPAAPSPPPPTDQEQHEGEAGRQEAITMPSRPPPAFQGAAEREVRGGPEAAPAVPLQSLPSDAEPPESEAGRQEAAAPPFQPPHSAGHEPPEGEPRRQEAAEASRIERLLAHRGLWRRRREAVPALLSPSSLTGQEAPESEAAITAPSVRPLIFREAAERGAGGGPEVPDAVPSQPPQEPAEGEAGRHEADAGPSQPTYQEPREREAGSPEAAAAPVPEREDAAGGPDAQPPPESALAGLPSRTQSPPDTSEADNLAIAWSRAPPRRRPVPGILFTCAAVAVAVGLGWAMWDAYMGAPWTRDGTVRVYVVTMAPEVAGHIVELPIADNQFVYKGDLLMRIDPTDYKIAVSLAEAALQQGAGQCAKFGDTGRAST